MVAGDEKVVVFSKMHHATVDGVSGSNLISHLCSLEPDAAPLAPREKLEPSARPHPSRAAGPGGDRHRHETGHLC